MWSRHARTVFVQPMRLTSALSATRRDPALRKRIVVRAPAAVLPDARVTVCTCSTTGPTWTTPIRMLAAAVSTAIDGAVPAAIRRPGAAGVVESMLDTAKSNVLQML
jgi:hypothetical protein